MPDSDQLSLSIESAGSTRRLPARIRPMQASAGDRAFDDPDYFFEPWWPGSRTILFLEDGFVRVQSEHLADPVAAFPELAQIADQVGTHAAILDGTLLVLDDEARPDTELLRSRLEAGSIGRDAAVGHPAFIATDLLHLDDQSLAARPYSERRARLETTLHDTETCVVGRGYRAEGETVARALTRMGIEAMSARRLSARYLPGDAGDAWLRLPVVPATTPPPRPTLTLIQRLPL